MAECASVTLIQMRFDRLSANGKAHCRCRAESFPGDQDGSLEIKTARQRARWLVGDQRPHVRDQGRMSETETARQRARPFVLSLSKYERSRAFPAAVLSSYCSKPGVGQLGFLRQRVQGKGGASVGDVPLHLRDQSRDGSKLQFVAEFLHKVQAEDVVIQVGVEV